ncbi:Lar family restriction alleviation protein [Vibrio phage 13VT501A]|nr:Lar family restriction alleviation protein [Vibrio phage 13VT501A]
MSNQLKPCPFCGGEVYHGEYSAYSCDSSFDAIVCDECGVYFDSQNESNKDASDRWNTCTESTELEQLRKELEETKKERDIAIKALLQIESSPFDVEGFGSASEVAAWMNNLATQTLAKLNQLGE